MQFVIQNNSSNLIAAFKSNINYTTQQLQKIISPAEVIKKITYDYYWRSIKNTDWVNHVQHQINPYLQMCGLAEPDAKIDVYNIVRVPEFLYIFYVTHEEKCAQLWYYRIQSRGLFSTFADQMVNIFSIAINDPAKYLADTEYNGGEAHVDYYDTPNSLTKQKLDWQPTDDTSSSTSDRPWLMPLVVLIFVAIVALGIIVTTLVLATGKSKESTYYINKNITEDRNEQTQPILLS